MHEIYESAQSAGHLTAARIIEEHARDVTAPVLQQTDQPPVGDVRRNEKFGNVADADAPEHGVDHEGPIVEDERAIDGGR